MFAAICECISRFCEREMLYPVIVQRCYSSWARKDGYLCPARVGSGLIRGIDGGHHRWYNYGVRSPADDRDDTVAAEDRQDQLPGDLRVVRKHPFAMGKGGAAAP